MKRFKYGCVLLMMLAWGCDGGNGSPTSPFFSGNAVAYQGERSGDGGTGRSRRTTAPPHSTPTVRRKT